MLAQIGRRSALWAATLIAVVVTCAPTHDANAAGIRFDRVDIIAASPGTWVNYELPTIATYPVRPALRLVEQVQVAWTIDAMPKLQIAVSLASQDIVYQDKIAGSDRLSWRAGITTTLLMPRGAYAVAVARLGRWQLGMGASAQSAARWSRISGFGQWTVMPTIVIGVGRAPK